MQCRRERTYKGCVKNSKGPNVTTLFSSVPDSVYTGDKSPAYPKSLDFPQPYKPPSAPVRGATVKQVAKNSALYQGTTLVGP